MLDDIEGGAKYAKDGAKDGAKWQTELKLSQKRHKDWISQAKKILDRYRSTKIKKNSFNILWANTEILRPAVYNSLPKPDVRRRFKDEDPIGKLVSEILGRALEYSVEAYDFDSVLKFSALDMLLTGRGISRARYIPTITTMQGTTMPGTTEPEENLEYEQVVFDHVQWDDFLHGPGKTWNEVMWIAYRHRMSRKECIDKFGEAGKSVKLDACEEEAGDSDDFKTAEVWEIWDKDEKEVLFLAEREILKRVPDPLELKDFFPSPRPVYAIEDSASLIPLPLYEQYREQAEELDKISSRINKIIGSISVKGIYDPTLGEIARLMDSVEADLIPAENVLAMLDRGGLEKAIWFMPIQQFALALRELYTQREAIKQILYELTGISDIVRGASDPRETRGAQEIKSQWGTQRLQRMQREFQRYVRDIVRIKADIIACKFQPETLLKMTSVKVQTQAEKQQAQMMLQQGQMEIQQGMRPPGPPPPELMEALSKPSLEEVVSLFRNDADMMFKIDIETDSTVAASIESDMSGLTEVLTGIAQFAGGIMPVIQSGMFPVEAAKEIITTIGRRSRMGSAVEDALGKIREPQPQQQPQPQPQNDNKEVEQARLQMDERIASARLQQELELERMRADSKAQTDLMVAKIEAETKIRIEEMRLACAPSGNIEESNEIEGLNETALDTA